MRGIKTASTQQQDNKMATITTTKHYEFCDDIFKNILSYTGYAKPMKTIGKRLLSKEIQEIFNWHHRVVNLRIIESAKADVTLVYRLRMLVSYEQLEFERSDIGKVALKNHEDYLDTFGVVNCVHMGGWFRYSGLEMWRHIMSLLRRWNWCHCDGDVYKLAHLTQICDAGKKSSKHHKNIEQQHIKNAKRREIVACEACGKTLTRGSLTRHMKKCSVV